MLAAANGAYALLIDFTDASVWSGANGTASFGTTDNGVQVNVATNIGTLSFNGGGSEPPGAIALSGGGSLAGQGDGLGVVRYNDADEINNRELMTVTIEDGFQLVEIFLLDIFRNEFAIITVDGASTEFQAPSSTPHGFQTVSIADLGSTLAITLTAPAAIAPYGSGDDGDHDFALAGLRLTPVSVPEPGSLALLGAGLLGIGLLRRRQSA
ncbi:MAG: PEP-CTERM sorting domain-containing protein [Pseudomonadales bacterium]